MNILPLPAIDGIAAVDWELAGNGSANLSVARTLQREVLDGDHWIAQMQFPPNIDDEAGIVDAWQAQARRLDRWLYLSPPQNKLRGAWSLADLVSNGTFVGGATTGWTGTGATLSVNARRLKVKNSGAAIGYARQTLTVVADAAYVLLVDLYPGNVEAWRLRLLDGSDVEEHVSYYNQAGRVPIVFIPSSTTIKVELGCNTAVSGDDVKFGNVTAARCLLVKDSLAVGNTLTVKGGPASTDAAVKAGQFVTIRLWNGWQMVKLVEDFDTDSAGEGALRFEPALRDGVLGGGPVIVHQPFARMVFSDPRAVASIRAPMIYETSVPLMEDVTPLDGEVPQDTDLIWGWFADSLSLAPTVGSGTPTLTADIDNRYTDSDSVLKQVAAANTPVFEFNPITKALKGQRIRSVYTNSCLHSNDFGNAAWDIATFPAVVSTNQAIGPSGSATMDKITSTAANNRHFARQIVAGASAGVAYTVQAVLKRGDTQYGIVGDSGDTFWLLASFDLDAGTVRATNTGVTARIQNLGGGRYLCSVSFTRAATGSFQLVCGPDLVSSTTVSGTDAGTYVGAGESVYAAHAQVHAGPLPAPIIDTTSAAVTKDADVSTLNTNLMTGFNTNTITAVGEVITAPATPTGVNHYAFVLDDGTSNEMVGVRRETTGNFALIVLDGGVVQAGPVAGVASGDAVVRFAAGAALNDVAVSMDGAAPVTDTAATMPTLTRLSVGRGPEGPIEAYIRRLAIYKAKKPNRQIRSLSA